MQKFEDMEYDAQWLLMFFRDRPHRVALKHTGKIDDNGTPIQDSLQ